MKRTTAFLTLLLCLCVWDAHGQNPTFRGLNVTSSACAVGTDMTNGWCQIAHTIAGSANQTSVTTSALNTIGVDTIVLVIHSYPGNYAIRGTDVSDSKLNTYTEVAPPQATGNAGVLMVYAAAPTVGSGHTFTVSNAAITYPRIEVFAVSGGHASPFDQFAKTSTTSVTSLASGSITPSQPNELIISGWTGDSSATASLAVNSGMTISDSGFGNATSNGGGMAYKTQSTAAAINPTWSWTAAADSAVIVASFKHS